MRLKMVHSGPNNTKSRVYQAQACFLHTTHLGILKYLVASEIAGSVLLGSPHRHWNRVHWIRITNPDSMWSHVSSPQFVCYAHCTAGLDVTHCLGALSCSTAHSLDPDRGCVETKWSVDPDPRSVSDPGSKVPCRDSHDLIKFLIALKALLFKRILLQSAVVSLCNKERAFAMQNWFFQD